MNNKINFQLLFLTGLKFRQKNFKCRHKRKALKRCALSLTSNLTMTEKSNFLNKAITGKLLVALTVIVALFWILGNSINVYGSAVVGVVFEILWLPMLACLFLIPVVSIIVIFKKNTPKLFPILSIIILSATFLYLTLYK